MTFTNNIRVNHTTGVSVMLYISYMYNVTLLKYFLAYALQ